MRLLLLLIVFAGFTCALDLKDMFGAERDIYIPKYQKHIPHVKNPEYIKVWRGSYRDSFGNYVEEGWEWIKIKEALPETNF